MITIDVIKLGYKQDREGFVVSFRIHPSDDHKELAIADIGSQWQLTATPLDDQGNGPQPDFSDPDRPF